MLEKINFQKRPPKKSEGVNLNVLTILDQTRIMHLTKWEQTNLFIPSEEYVG